MTTICAIATSGGAIGIIRVSGEKAINAVDSIFRTPNSTPLSSRKAYTCHYGHIFDEDGNIIDEVIINLYRAPHSYTGEDSVEIMCHASSHILQSVVSLLCKHGCTLAQPGEYTQRAFLNGKLDLSQAEAVADLIAAQNASQHKVAMQHLRGGITTRLHQLRDKLLHLTSLLELELDFSDHEELEFADRNELFSIAHQVEREIHRLSSSFSQGNAIKNGIPVAIIGAPNVGKSSLLNALLDDEKAIVSPIQGTTRDLIEDTITIDGVLFRFIDTAGIRNTDDTIEQMGIERSYKVADKAQIIILITEPGVPFIKISQKEGQTTIHVVNKTDKLENQDSTSISISALTGEGLDTLRQQLIDAVSFDDNHDEVLITNLRHKESLDQAYQDIQRAIQAMSNGIPSDLVAEDLRLCITHLADILGSQITDQEILQNIFKHFCIGK